jgi:hypothetical protein
MQSIFYTVTAQFRSSYIRLATSTHAESAWPDHMASRYEYFQIYWLYIPDYKSTGGISIWILRMRLITLRHNIFCSTRLTQTSKYDALFWTTYTTFKGQENWKWMFWSYVYAVDETGLGCFRWLLGALVCRAHRRHIKIDCLCMVASMYHYSNMTSRANKSLAWRVRQNTFGHLCY